MDEPCRACGGKLGALVCLHCGATVGRGLNPQEEQDALDELHGSLARKDVGESVLKNAFIPDDLNVLINAGLRMLPVLESAVAEDGAAGRLRAIIIKLRLHPGDPTVDKAAAEFATALTRYERHDRQVGYWVLALAVVTIGLLVLGLTRCD